jgi:hypothetical protein
MWTQFYILAFQPLTWTTGHTCSRLGKETAVSLSGLRAPLSFIDVATNYIGSKDWVTVKNKLEGMWKRQYWSNLRTMRILLGGTEDNQKKTSVRIVDVSGSGSNLASPVHKLEALLLGPISSVESLWKFVQSDHTIASIEKEICLKVFQVDDTDDAINHRKTECCS